jgi:hypothetical protein
MSDSIINVPEGDFEPVSNQKTASENDKKNFLQNLSNREIAEIFADEDSSYFKDKGGLKVNRVLVIPIGFPQAGKSLLFSSLLNFAITGSGDKSRPSPFTKTLPELKWPFTNGAKACNDMVKTFRERKELYAANAKNTFDLIGINIKPVKNYPPLPLAFLDLAGEDIKGIKISEGGTFTDKINAVFNGLKIYNSPVVFVLITPFDPPRQSGESSRNAHDREDTLHQNFLNYMEMMQSELLKNAKFFIIVSQWDKNLDPNLSVETFMREKRPAVYQFVNNMNVVWGSYSVGKLLETEMVNDRGEKYIDQQISRINYEAPERFWKKLYQICTNINLDQKTFWEKLFG